jgi:hypothetical protein
MKKTSQPLIDALQEENYPKLLFLLEARGHDEVLRLLWHGADMPRVLSPELQPFLDHLTESRWHTLRQVMYAEQSGTDTALVAAFFATVFVIGLSGWILTIPSTPAHVALLFVWGFIAMVLWGSYSQLWHEFRAYRQRRRRYSGSNKKSKSDT